MSTFVIEFLPPLPRATRMRTQILLSELDVAKVMMSFTEEYDIRYHVDGAIFCYYPASILTVLNDIHLEWELIRKRESHRMTLSGYPVLDLDFSGGMAYFFDPAERVMTSDAPPIGNAFEPEIIEEAFKAAVESIWLLIKSRE